MWVGKWIDRRNQDRGAIAMLEKELRQEDPNSFKNFCRMDGKTFDCLLEKVRPCIQKQNTRMRECINHKVRCVWDSPLGRALKEKTLNIPAPRPLPRGYVDVPFDIVVDDAFPPSPYIMKPFAMKGLTHARRIYNYRVSRARRTIENVFSILAQRFRIFQTKMIVSVEKVELITLTCCVLHNFLRTRIIEENNALTENNQKR
ncbi:hypothetical protein PR048_025295 [Dryococelus australis]|uniref:DDE Tnp4 domain-containing protein n=1 Tax=Dryococelus australis TaxID=614101 RepID=A0ABQ9GR24_9NEOP|nr:hypothetical protein PR048_025295 [Dryococelus australis]